MTQTDEPRDSAETTDPEAPEPAETPEQPETAEPAAEQTTKARAEVRTDDPDQDSDQDGAGSESSDELDPAALQEIAATVEAILFSIDEPISPSKIAQVAELPNRRVVKQAIYHLNERYEQMGCAFTIESIAGGFQFMTREEYHDVLARLLKVRSDSRLTRAALETLAVVAYRQPIIRADIESIRGVACGDMLRKLMDKNLVKITGRAEVLGRPMLYGTTSTFLEVFGLNSLDDLPNAEELKAPVRQPDGEPKDKQQDQAESEAPTDDEQSLEQEADYVVEKQGEASDDVQAIDQVDDVESSDEDSNEKSGN